MSEGKLVAKSTIIIVITKIISMGLGFMRDMVIAATFGASYKTDAYLVANVVPVIIFTTVNSALNTTFIPVFTERLYCSGKKNAFRLACIIINVVFLLALVVTIGGTLLTPKIISIIAPGFSGKVFQLAVELTRIMFPMIIFLSLSAILSGVLNSFRDFTTPAMVGIPQNLIIIFSVVFFGHSYGIKGLAWGTLIGISSQYLFQMPAIRKLGMRYKMILDLKDPGIKQMGLLIWPILFGSTASQINVIVNRILASGLPEGSISALNYADRLNSAALAIFAATISAVIYPLLSEHSATGNQSRFRRLAVTSLNVTIFFMVPLAVGIFILRIPIITLLFQRGAFGVNDTQITAIALQYYVIGMTALALQMVVAKIYYSLQDTRTPMLNGIFTIGLNICLCLLLVKSLGHGGLALATSISANIGLLINLYFLRRKMGSIGGFLILQCFLKCLLSAAIMAIPVFYLNLIITRNYKEILSVVHLPVNALRIMHLSLLGLTGLLIYYFCAHFLKIREVKMMRSLLPLKKPGNTFKAR